MKTSVTKGNSKLTVKYKMRCNIAIVYENIYLYTSFLVTIKTHNT